MPPCRGVLLYPDPDEVAREGQNGRNVAPNTRWLPGDGVRFGSVLNGAGDPQTPGWPSVRDGHRIAHADNLISALPKIPVQPIGYSDARRILKDLGGQDPPRGWVGGLRRMSYKLGGEFLSNSEIEALRITVNNTFASRDVPNVIGVLRGSVEPDRYVVVGGHRDSWGNGGGAVNPGTATTAIVMLAKSFAKVARETGWRPRRTIVFASWAAEEFGLIGSTEWVEENLPKMMSRAVAYLNTDMCVSGPDLDATASPALKSVLEEAAKSIPYPGEDEVTGERSYYDYWRGGGGPSTGCGIWS